MKITWLFLTYIWLIAGCASASPATADAPSGPLRQQIGFQVKLSGRFSGPGKFADYIVVSGEPVYLTDPPPSFAPPTYGTHVTAAGKLEYFVPPPDPCDRQTDCPYDLLSAHYFIKGAEIRVVP